MAKHKKSLNHMSKEFARSVNFLDMGVAQKKRRVGYNNSAAGNAFFPLFWPKKSPNQLYALNPRLLKPGLLNPAGTVELFFSSPA